MANFYTDSPELKHYLNHPLMKRIVELRERDFEEKDIYAYAPQDHEDAMDNYDKVLDIIGEICGDIIAPNAEGVDHEGATCEGGHVRYAPGTEQNLDALRKAGLMGMSMPRRYGGLNFPSVAFMVAADMVSRADDSFENLWALQDCAETIYEFGSEEQKQHYIGRVCSGETMSMDLTEPDAGSDLQSAQLRATYSEEDGCWYLNGVKRFITNGDSDIHLVLARSEEGTKDGRGLSMFIYDKRSGGVTVRRIESKMGIKGSPTCELVYNNARAELCGERRLGLIKYVMALMNGARLGIAAQTVGISQAAYEEALTYARSRRQFDKPIIEMAPVSEMLSHIKAKLDATRSILYQTSRYVDIYKTLEDLSKERKLTPEERKEQKYYAKLADSFTPLSKGLGSELCNQNVDDCVQIHGGSGYMKDYACERLYRDARVTNIYEGTTQMQVIAAIRYATSGFYAGAMREFAEWEVSPELSFLKARLDAMVSRYEEAVNTIVEFKSQELTDLTARRLVEMAGYIIMGYLLLQDATTNAALFATSAQVFVRWTEGEVDKHTGYISRISPDDLVYFCRR